MLRVPDRETHAQTVSPAQLHACEMEMGGCGCGEKRKARGGGGARSRRHTSPAVTTRARYWNVRSRLSGLISIGNDVTVRRSRCSSRWDVCGLLCGEWLYTGSLFRTSTGSSQSHCSSLHRLKLYLCYRAVSFHNNVCRVILSPVNLQYNVRDYRKIAGMGSEKGRGYLFIVAAVTAEGKWIYWRQMNKKLNKDEPQHHCSFRIVILFLEQVRHVIHSL